MKLDKLQKLYINELRDLYNAENQLLKALPKMAKAASSPELKQAFEKHLEQTKSHVERLEEVFEDINEKPKGKTCHGMKGLIEEGSEILQEEGDESVIDAGIIVAAQKVEHYEIAGYGSVRTLLSCSERRDPRSFSKPPSMRNRRRMRRSTNWLKRSYPEALVEAELAEARNQ